jgi:hypothetical protein
MKPEEGKFFTIPSVFGAKINSSNRKTFPNCGDIRDLG